MASNGKLPDSWKRTTLGDISDVRRGASPRPIGNPKWFSDHGPGWVRIVDVTRSRKYLRQTEQKLSEAGAKKSVRVAPGDVIMSICATIGCPVIVDLDACIHDGFVLFDKLSTSVDPEYLCAFLSQESERFARQGQKGTQGNLNTTIVKSTPFPLPPKGVQSQIVNILNSVDEAIEATRAVIDQTRKLKTALLQDLLTNGLPGRHKKFTRVYRIGKVPKAWSETRIEQAAEVTQGIALGPSRVARQNPTPYLRVANVHQGVIHLDEIKCIETTSNEREQYALELDDVLMVEGHANIEELGRAALVPPSAVGMVFQNHLFRVRSDRSKLDPRFLTLWINSHPGRAYFKIFGGTTSGLNTVGSNQIRTLRLPLPPIDEQKEICDLVEAIEQRGLHSEKTLEQLQTVKSALSQGLLTGRIPVKGISND